MPKDRYSRYGTSEEKQERLLKVRLEITNRGLTQKEVAKALGVHPVAMNSGLQLTGHAPGLVMQTLLWLEKTQDASA